MKYIIAIAMLLIAITAHAAKKPMPYNEALISDFITSHAACKKGKLEQCERTMKLCPLVIAKKTELARYMWEDYPYKTKNGGMNITVRFNNAIHFCTK